MSRAQMIAFAVVGGIAIAAWLQSYKIGKFVAKLSSANGTAMGAGQWSV